MSANNPHSTKTISYKDKEEVVLGDVVWIYDAYYERLDRRDKPKEGELGQKIEVLCASCRGASFTLSYGNYECIAHCPCGHSFTVYDG